MRRALLFLVLLGIVGGGLFATFRKPEEETEVTTSRVQVARKELLRTVEAVGLVEPAFLLEIKSKASGTITSMPFQEGDRVRPGDLLVELLPVDEERNVRSQQTQVRSAEAQVARSRNQLRQARLQLEIQRAQVESRLEAATVAYEVAQHALTRQEALVAKELASQSEVEQARQAAESAESTLELARLEERTLELQELQVEASREDVKLQEAALERQRIALEVASLRLSETRIVSPMAGLVLTRSVEPGQIIASGISNVSGGTTLMTLADVDRLFLDTEVDESDVGGIRPGLEVRLVAEAYPRKHFRGTIQRVAPQGESVSNVTIFRVRIELDDEAVGKLLPGMNATATIVVEREPEGLVIPVKALERVKRQVGVRLGDGSFVPVELGLRVGGEVAVRGDLEEGQELVFVEEEGSGSSSGRRRRRRGIPGLGPPPR